jgi:hypothetical protein
MTILSNYDELYAFFFGNEDFQPQSDDVIGKVQLRGELLERSKKYNELEFGDENQCLMVDENGMVTDCRLYYY